jgi:hypothetical protein
MMGNLTNDMTRLRGEVDALRSDRGALIKDRVATVSTLLSDFAAAHATMARKTGKARASYVARIKKQVGQMRKENASDLAGASHAWFAF